MKYSVHIIRIFTDTHIVELLCCHHGNFDTDTADHSVDIARTFTGDGLPDRLLFSNHKRFTKF